MAAHPIIGHGPHVHTNLPARFDYIFPDGREDGEAFGAEDVVVAIVDLGANDVDMEERLLDEIFETLSPFHV